MNAIQRMSIALNELEKEGAKVIVPTLSVDHFDSIGREQLCLRVEKNEIEKGGCLDHWLNSLGAMVGHVSRRLEEKEKVAAMRCIRMDVEVQRTAMDEDETFYVSGKVVSVDSNRVDVHVEVTVDRDGKRDILTSTSIRFVTKPVTESSNEPSSHRPSAKRTHSPPAATPSSTSSSAPLPKRSSDSGISSAPPLPPAPKSVAAKRQPMEPMNSEFMIVNVKSRHPEKMIELKELLEKEGVTPIDVTWNTLPIKPTHRVVYYFDVKDIEKEKIEKLLLDEKEWAQVMEIDQLVPESKAPVFMRALPLIDIVELFFLAKKWNNEHAQGNQHHPNMLMLLSDKQNIRSAIRQSRQVQELLKKMSRAGKALYEEVKERLFGLKSTPSSSSTDIKTLLP